ncbi:MAG: leucine--tRNA ligase [Planctomycetes bacterium]|nr:leucine--tRNA ligase [Planctomycetota bacterium]
MTEYNPKTIEPKWQASWEKIGLYQTPETPKKKFYLLEMFAYPSGDIHIGHFRNYTIGDVFWRFKKMQGFDLLHPFGWDAFGLPAEEAAIKKKMPPREWTLNNIKTSRATLKKMAVSYDWEREVTTCLPDYYQWSQWIFLTLYKRGLAYQASSLVNWCPSCKTVLANEQVQTGQCWRCNSEVTKRELKQWFIKITDYAERLLKGLDKLTGWPENIKAMQRNWIGRSEGAEIKFKIPDPQGDVPNEISIFTTRPDTIYGVTFMAIAPEHPLALKLTTSEQKKAVEDYIRKATKKSDLERTAEGEKDGVFTGSYVINPFSGEKAQLWVADYVLVHYGTGIVMAVPAHDQRDFEFAQKYNIPIKVVIKPPESRIPDPATMTEAYVDPGIMVNSGPFNDLPSEKGITKTIQYAVDKKIGQATVNYRLRDWLISRQRYWGAPIPMIHCAKCGVVPVPEKDLPVRLPENIKDFIPKGRSPLADVPEFIKTKCPKCNGPAERDVDTMDTFICSSWYHLRYSDPKNGKEIFNKTKAKQWLPIDLYIGGSEHACGHLIYFRFITKVLKDAGWLNFEEPATRLFNHGMVLDEKGDVMSKSKGNAVSPINLANEWGVDTSRLAMLFFAPSEWEIRWTEKGLVGAKRFLVKVWNLVHNASGVPNKNAQPTTQDAKRLYRKMHQTIKKVTADIDPVLHYNTAISAIMELVNEIHKVLSLKTSVSSVEPSQVSSKPVIGEAIRTVVLLLAPMVPHLAEELWEKLGNNDTIFKQLWPSYDKNAIQADEIELPVQVNGRLRSRITVPATADEETIKQKALADEKIKSALGGKPPRKMIVVPKRLVNIVVS